MTQCWQSIFQYTRCSGSMVEHWIPNPKAAGSIPVCVKYIFCFSIFCIFSAKSHFLWRLRMLTIYQVSIWLGDNLYVTIWCKDNKLIIYLLGIYVNLKQKWTKRIDGFIQALKRELQLEFKKELLRNWKYAFLYDISNLTQKKN